jgi:adenosylhomocysteinase
VIITEVDAFKALQAVMDGFTVMPMAEAAKLGNIFVTVTGNKKVINKNHIEQMKNGAILANAGHFDVEIDVLGLEKIAVKKTKVRNCLDEYTLKNGKKVYLCGEGRLVNLACGEGHPSTIMSLSFMNQALAVEYLVKNKNKLQSGVHVLPKEIDDKVARLQLESMNVKTDFLTPEQKKYLTTWIEGT